MTETVGGDRTTCADPPMLVCARYDVLRAVAEASGVEITLWAIPNKKYQVSFRIKNQAQEWYLAHPAKYIHAAGLRESWRGGPYRL